MSFNSVLTCNGLGRSAICEAGSMVLSLFGSIRHRLPADLFSFSTPHKLFYPMSPVSAMRACILYSTCFHPNFPQSRGTRCRQAMYFKILITLSIHSLTYNTPDRSLHNVVIPNGAMFWLA